MLAFLGTNICLFSISCRGEKRKRRIKIHNFFYIFCAKERGERKCIPILGKSKKWHSYICWRRRFFRFIARFLWSFWTYIFFLLLFSFNIFHNNNDQCPLPFLKKSSAYFFACSLFPCALRLERSSKNEEGTV